MRVFQSIYIVAQVVFALLLMIFAAANAIRCFISESGTVYYILFSIMAAVAYKMMFIPSIRELRDFLIKK